MQLKEIFAAFTKLPKVGKANLSEAQNLVSRVPLPPVMDLRVKNPADTVLSGWKVPASGGKLDYSICAIYF